MSSNDSKNYRSLYVIAAGFWVTIIAYVIFAKSPYFDVFQAWVSEREVAYSFILFSLKVVGIIWPPLPGGIFTFVSIPVLGWQQAYLLDLAGSMVGSVVAFFIARRWGMVFIKKIFDEATVSKIQKIKVRKHRELEAVFMFRIFGGSIVEVVCYGAGLLNIKFHNFLIGSIFSHLAIGLPTYYFAAGLFSGKRMVTNLIFGVVIVILFILLKNRYFHLDENN